MSYDSLSYDHQCYYNWIRILMVSVNSKEELKKSMNLYSGIIYPLRVAKETACDKHKLFEAYWQMTLKDLQEGVKLRRQCSYKDLAGEMCQKDLSVLERFRRW